jgi:hypothetical protein
LIGIDVGALATYYQRYLLLANLSSIMSIILDSPSAQHDFSRGPYWYHESPFLPIGESDRNEPGSPSLKDTAIRRLLMDQSALKPELFEHVPWKIAKELWEFLGSR